MCVFLSSSSESVRERLKKFNIFMIAIRLRIVSNIYCVLILCVSRFHITRLFRFLCFALSNISISDCENEVLARRSCVFHVQLYNIGSGYAVSNK